MIMTNIRILDTMLDMMHAEIFHYLIIVAFVRTKKVFGADVSLSVHIDNKKKYFLILGKGPANSLDDITLIAEKEYSTNFTEQQKKLCLSFHYNGVNSYRFVNGVEIHEFNTKDSKTNAGPLCLGNVSL